MELKSNEYVVFTVNGKEYKAGHLEAVWSRKQKAFWILDDNGEKVFSTDVRTKEKKTRKATDCKMVEIVPDTATEKAYGIVDGTNGSVVKGNIRVYYKWIAKSICKEENGKIYAPVWALR